MIKIFYWYFNHRSNYQMNFTEITKVILSNKLQSLNYFNYFRSFSAPNSSTYKSLKNILKILKLRKKYL